MTFILNAWYVIARPPEISADALFARTVCNLPMVLWRDLQGRVAALEDRCCHREMPLAMGRVESGTVRCGYHGLRFDSDGRCIEVPGHDTVPRGLQVRTYPVIERFGFVWVWPGNPELADPALVWDQFECNDHPEWAAVGGTTYLNGNYQLITDNLLDLTHEHYIHASSLGAQAIIDNPIDTKVEGDRVSVTRWMLDSPPGPFWERAMASVNGYDGPCDRWQIIHFQPPANVVLDVGAALPGTGAPHGDRSRALVACNLNAITPETDTTSWYFFVLARRFQIDNEEFSRNLLPQLRRIQDEDKIAINAIQNVISRHPGRETFSLRIDTGALAARRIVQRILATENLAAAKEPRSRMIEAT